MAWILPAVALAQPAVKDYGSLVRSYARQSRKYDRRWRHYNEATLAATLAAIPGETFVRMLDVGCGTGLLEQALGKRVAPLDVVGLDVSPDMLRQARQKSGFRGRVCWVNGQAECLPFASGSFDAVVCANSFHFFRKPDRAMQEFRRVLCPGGWLVLTDWCDDYLACKILDRILRVVDRAHFRTYGLKQCEDLLTELGFQIEMARRFKIDWLWGLMTLQART